ncbi:uncharacterized protein BO80DRAFT_429746 [Aspergillus ibericus CBS 121593]|uniref:Uncharacterized protein n=1 Tax=Aspergillus ibericus CBS 121593 TaxID=1448316 RepID=A0A395GJB4_9EURO|nr:hypothetical protein BO80DRAFT_429746 [Aspergillus ibericus CBS 121593]RAK95571.1 hypothetical protein BO80DRAFT_429746 [Aspergillus ibericus CBS 121593]
MHGGIRRQAIGRPGLLLLLLLLKQRAYQTFELLNAIANTDFVLAGWVRSVGTREPDAPVGTSLAWQLAIASDLATTAKGA